MSGRNTFIGHATARQPQRIIVGEGQTIDAVQATGAWIAMDADDCVEARE